MASSNVSDIFRALATAGVKVAVTAPSALFLLFAVMPIKYRMLLMILFRCATSEFVCTVKSLDVNPLDARTGGEPCSMMTRQANKDVNNVRTITLSDGLIILAFPRTSSVFAVMASDEAARAPQMAN
tara:strand:+ start:142 stop:522 length:381 start_codon:yes stop_codon:yes gene_type:complete